VHERGQGGRGEVWARVPVSVHMFAGAQPVHVRVWRWVCTATQVSTASSEHTLLLTAAMQPGLDRHLYNQSQASALQVHPSSWKESKGAPPLAAPPLSVLPDPGTHLSAHHSSCLSPSCRLYRHCRPITAVAFHPPVGSIGTAGTRAL